MAPLTLVARMCIRRSWKRLYKGSCLIKINFKLVCYNYSFVLVKAL